MGSSAGHEPSGGLGAEADREDAPCDTLCRCAPPLVRMPFCDPLTHCEFRPEEVAH